MSKGGPPLSMLARPLHEDERRAIARRFARALRAGRSCALPATAFVSLYERGRVIGCVGHADMALALAAARVDPRFGGARELGGRATVQLSLLVRGRRLPPAAAAEAIELGREGMVGFDEAGAIRAVLLPDVAADGQRGGDAMLGALFEKAGEESVPIASVMLIRRERFVVRPSPVTSSRASLVDLAARWLAARVDADGAIAHGVDARAGRVHRTGPMHLGRAAVVLEALAAHRGHRAVVRRGRAWLAAAIDDALAGSGEGLPRAAPERAATLALALRAGIDCGGALVELALASSEEIARVPWHAAQIVTALGASSPYAIRAAALVPIDDDTWAPWSALAADAIGDARRAKRARARLARAIPRAGPHAGGVRARSVAECALTALVIEVLARSPAHHAATRRALGFLEAQAFARPSDVPAAVDPALAIGAFPLAPHADFLRADVTAHALLAMLAARRAKIRSR
jgi:hypothetical protein